MLNFYTRNRGFTLIEMLIALLLGGVLLAMVVGIYVTNVTAGAKAMKLSRLRTDLQGLVSLMEDDIRRAGYGGSAFRVGVGKSKSIDTINSTTEKCIVYSYNYNDGDIDNPSTSHFMGFRYAIDTQSVQFGSGVGLQASECFSTGSWVNLTDPNFMAITELSFSESSVSSAMGAAVMRSVEINVAAELVSNTDYSHQMQTKVQVRNLEF